MIVMKFGGSSVGSSERIKSTASIISLFKDKNPVVVLSAVGGITDMLIEAARNAAEKHLTEINEIKNKHLDIIKELNLNLDLLDNEFSELSEILDVASKTKDNSKKIIDLIISFGERFSTRIVSAYLNSINLNSMNYDAYELGMVTDSNFGSAEVLNESYNNLKDAITKKDGILVVTGFIAKDKEGQVTTLGRGGSDYTAAIIGSAINAEEIQIWTDVNGVMTTDPRIVKSAKSIPKISFREAAESAAFGAKVLHPKTIIPAVKKDIPVKVLNSFNPEHLGTTIVRECPCCEGIVRIISLKRNITIFNIHSTRMLHAHGFLSKVFEIFAKNEISVDMIATSEVSISLTIDGSYDDNLLARTKDELRRFSGVSIENNKSIVCLVGCGMKKSFGVGARIFDTIARNNINVEMVSQGASEINLGFVVDESEAESAVKCLHSEFFD